MFVEESVYDKFNEMLKEKVEKTVIGDPRKRDTFLGPVINKNAVEKLKKFVNQAVSEGGK